jgi:hypothetical protein
MNSRPKIQSGVWWRALSDTFDKIARYQIQKALETEQKETGHQCGHEFEISVSSRLHMSGLGEHSDADWTGELNSVKVRAHNLRDALLIAASLPLVDWFPEEEESNGRAE